MSIYSEFRADAKEILSEVGRPALVAGNQFLVMLSDPLVAPVLEAGGYIEKKGWTVRFAAATGPWTASDGRVGGQVATLASGVPIASLSEGKKLTVNGQTVRIVTQSHKQDSAWITVTVIDDNQ